MIRMLELVHCVEAGFGEGKGNKRRKKNSEKPIYQQQVLSLGIRPCSLRSD